MSAVLGGDSVSGRPSVIFQKHSIGIEIFEFGNQRKRGVSQRRESMTEYSAASPLAAGYQGVNRYHTDHPERGYVRSNPFIGTCRAVRSTIEQFEAALDAEHEVAISLASFGSSIEFRADEINISPSNLITFHGVTDSGERVHLVQHVSQVSLLLKAVRKLNDIPTRVVFQYGAA